MGFEDNTMLFGFDPTPRIVAIEMGDTGTVRVYRREKDGSTVVRHRAVSSVRLGGCAMWPISDRERREARRRSEVQLAGHVDSWKELIALRNGLKSAGRSFFALSDPVQHYLTHTGRTLFKGLPFEELKRLQLEVISLDRRRRSRGSCRRTTSRASPSRITAAGKN